MPHRTAFETVTPAVQRLRYEFLLSSISIKMFKQKRIGPAALLRSEESWAPSERE